MTETVLKTKRYYVLMSLSRVDLHMIRITQGTQRNWLSLVPKSACTEHLRLIFIVNWYVHGMSYTENLLVLVWKPPNIMLTQKRLAFKSNQYFMSFHSYMTTDSKQTHPSIHMSKTVVESLHFPSPCLVLQLFF